MLSLYLGTLIIAIFIISIHKRRELWNNQSTQTEYQQIAAFKLGHSVFTVMLLLQLFILKLLTEKIFWHLCW